MNIPSEKHPFAIEISRVIEVLASQIYPSPFALLRENVQNAFDAILLRRHKGDDFVPQIEVTIAVDRISISDNGIGMSKDDLRNHFWRAGSSSKNTNDARAAGVVGTFGIGAMANFGIAECLTVITEAIGSHERIKCEARRSTLSVTEDCIEFSDLPVTGVSGTIIVAELQEGKRVDVVQATEYVKSFVEHLQIPVTVNAVNLSERSLENAVPPLVETWRHEATQVAIGNSMTADVSVTGAFSGEVRIDVSNMRLDSAPIYGRLILKQGMGALRTFRSRFGLATTAVSSAFQFGGVADFLFLQPTAGREALTTESMQFLQGLVGPIDELVAHLLSDRPESNVNQHFVNWAASHGRWDLCSNLRVRVEPGRTATLAEICAQSHKKAVVVYTGADASIISLASEERPMVVLTRGSQRQRIERTFLEERGRVELLSDDPTVLSLLSESEYSLAQSAAAFRIASILLDEYFVAANVVFGKISHGLPLLVQRTNEALTIVLDPDGNSMLMMQEVYDREFVAFGHMSKDFVRTVIFPKISDLVPSATRQGAEAFLKTIHKSRETFEYEVSDLENLASLWQDYLDGKISKQQATTRSANAARSYQYIDSAASGSIRDVVPDVIENSETLQGIANFDAAPAIERLDIETDRKLLTLSEVEAPLNGYRCFIAITDGVRRDKGDFFRQPHRTSIVWGGQKALFIFEHHSGEFGLYYDIQMPGPVSDSSGGGSFQTSTIVMKNRIFLPIPEGLRASFIPEVSERKRFEIRCDILYIDR